MIRTFSYIQIDAFHVHLFLADTCSRSCRARTRRHHNQDDFLPGSGIGKKNTFFGEGGGPDIGCRRGMVSYGLYRHSFLGFLSRSCRSGSFYQSQGPGCNLEWVFLLHCVHQCCLSGARPTVVPRYDRTGTGQGTSLSCLAIDD